MNHQDLAKLRGTIAIKTFTALIKRHKEMTEIEENKQLKTARRFAKGLFWNVKGSSSR